MSSNIFDLEINKLKTIKSEYKSLFDNDDFLEYDDIYSITNNMLPNKIKFKLKYIFLLSNYYKYTDKWFELKSLIDDTKKIIDEHNDRVIKEAKENFKNICGLIENKELDDQQVDAIVRKNRNQLVIAGAGSGKTTTIVGKVKYLLLKEKYNPEDILLLSFTNASAAEMKGRVKNETGINLDVMTFHKLGLEIIKKGLNKEIKIFDKDLYQVVKDLINKNIKESDYFSKLLYFISTARFNERDESDFENKEEYNEYLKTNKPTTLKGEVVKSYGELEIANYLFSNSINYVYEQEYKFDTVSNDYQQYYPDFYLPDHDIYIEYFGIDENNEVASFFKGKNDLSASESYNNSINWKRNIHKANNTKMVETYYFENKKGVLISNLEKKLKSNNVKINPKTDAEIWEIIKERNSGISGEICRVFSTIITLIKSNDYLIDYVESFQEVQNSKLNKITLELIKPIYEDYQKMLQSNNMIDFNDMINTATDCIISNKYIHNYKYVIVDEYQDMSNSRYRLLEAMRKQKEFKLFCVGDDWQSIYRFNGSDIKLITDFEKYWGNTYLNYIIKTYRFTSMMSKLSGDFIMKNNYQYKKVIDAKPSENLAIKFIKARTESKCLEFLEEKLQHFDKNNTVYLLGRYSFDIDILKNNKNFKYQYIPGENTTNVIYNKRKDLKIKFLTVHKSKGLQADYVVILNNKDYGMGFPSKINDLPLVRVLLADRSDDYPFSEERRLFYVALTRSRKQTLLLVVDSNRSIFVNELEAAYKKLIRTDKKLKESVYKCPRCGGKLVCKKGPYSKFWGCSNFPNCRYTRNY